ncbi:uncharacterized protein EI97DRAFT_433859 [Westerdykella ornata]|uniref:Uncharacterized protein n=1 Tax=Westerdykella ornata TaxID=318751 RepID=A0A6A6JIK0_WESOR|nr:uncharacterized protein EI97DRAFT_433859 [Westerdykella ornata]KAF2275923.1 hypothetical protein EI97DRAFT_433859 [Westerdykella ornata]
MIFRASIRTILTALLLFTSPSYTWTFNPFNDTLEYCEIWDWHTQGFGSYKGAPFCAHRLNNSALVYAMKTYSDEVKISVIDLYFTDEAYMRIGDTTFTSNSSTLIENKLYLRPHNTSISSFIGFTVRDFEAGRGTDALHGFRMQFSDGQSLQAGRMATYAGKYSMSTPVRLAGLSGTVCKGVLCTLRVHGVTVLGMPGERNLVI